MLLKVFILCLLSTQIFGQWWDKPRKDILRMKKNAGMENQEIFSEEELDEIFYGTKKSEIPNYPHAEVEQMAHRNKS